MKIIYLVLVFLFCITSCKENKGLDKCSEKNVSEHLSKISDSNGFMSHVKNTEDYLKSSPIIKYSDAIGMWAASPDTNENATFQIYKDSIEYLDMDSADRFYRISMFSDTFMIFLDNYTITQKIILLNDNIFITVNQGDTEIAYRRW